MEAKVDDKLEILERPRCELCQKYARHRCGGCHRVYYCTKLHQNQHWRQHKQLCRSFKICEKDSAWSLAAVQVIPPGEFVLQEAALVWGPSFNTVPVCLGCGREVSDENSRPCNKCGWPICGDLCEKSPGHLPECRYTAQRGERVCIKKFGVPHPIYRCIAILRCLYLKQFLPKCWRKLEKLESRENRQTNVNFENEKVTTAEFIRRFFKLWSVFSVDEVARVCELVMMNYHEVPLTTPPYIAIFGTTSLVRHDCRANCSISFTNLGEIVITAVTNIEEGENLTISYTNPLFGTQNRRAFLYEKKFFWCKCQRCEDVTEFGTNFNSLRCQTTDCDGYLLPDSFTNCQKVPDWSCAQCSRTVSSYLVYDILERVSHDLEDLDKKNIEDCKIFIETYGRYLHENHFYLVGVKFGLCQLLGLERLSDEDLDLKYEMCQNLENLFRIVAAAERRSLGILVFEKYGAFEEFCKRAESTEGKNNLLEAKKMLLECVKFLKNEPDLLPEGKIFLKAKQKLVDIGALLDSLSN